MIGRMGFGRPLVVRPRGMPLLRGAIVGGTAYAVGRHSANNAYAEQAQSQQLAEQQSQLEALNQQQAAEQQAAMQRQMQEQALAQARAEVAAQQPAAPAAGGDLMAQLNQLTQMQQQGLLTAEEFAAAKARLLG